MKLSTLVAAVFGLLLTTQANSATETFSAAGGLEVSDTRSIPVLIADLPSNETKRGLSKDVIEARVNAVLRNNGLKPVEATEATDHNYRVQVLVAGTTVFIQAAFSRAVTYNNGIAERHTRADTWSRLYLNDWNLLDKGHSGAAVDSILDQVSRLTEQFANEFLKANGK